MKILFLLLNIITILNSTVNAAGGDRVGNGGDVVVCGDKVELLDLYEMSLKGKAQLPISGSDPVEMALQVIDKVILPIQKNHAELLKKYLNDFMKEAQFLAGIELSDVNDAGMVVIPKGCKLEQIIVQLSGADVESVGYRYAISLDLWNKLNSYNQMALILHEIVFREIINLDENGNSMSLRNFIGQVLDKNMDLILYLKANSLFSSMVEFFEYYISKVKDARFQFQRENTNKDSSLISITSTDIRGFHTHFKNLNNNIYSTKVILDERSKKIVQIMYENSTIFTRARKDKTYSISEHFKISSEEDFNIFYAYYDGVKIYFDDTNRNLKLIHEHNNEMLNYSFKNIGENSLLFHPFANTIRLISDSNTYTFVSNENESLLINKNQSYRKTVLDIGVNYWAFRANHENPTYHTKTPWGHFECSHYFSKYKDYFSLSDCKTSSLNLRLRQMPSITIPAQVRSGAFTKDGLFAASGTSNEFTVTNDFLLGKVKKGIFGEKKDVVLIKGTSYEIIEDEKNQSTKIISNNSEFEFKNGKLQVNKWP